MMNRRLFLTGTAGLAACKPSFGKKPLGSSLKGSGRSSKRMAITMDDFAQSFDIGMSLETRNENILGAFDTVGHKAAGFVTGSMVDNPWGSTVVESWRRAGHLIGDHTWSHKHANEMTSDGFLSDVERNSAFLSKAEERPKYFRFPFLDDGNDRAHQDALFAGLKNLNLVNAPVTIDTVDWFTTSRLEARLRENPTADLTPYRDYYVNMCVRLANHWDYVATALGNIDLPHLTLMHHNILNGHFLKDVLLALKGDGWEFVDAKEALDFRPYGELPPEPTHGRNWLTLKRLEMGLELQPYPEEYQSWGGKTMDALGL